MTKRLSEVADFAGVSTATVGRVLNGKPGIAPETRDAVLTALDVFGIERPRNFREDRASLVGMVVPDLQNPIFPAFSEAVSLRLAKLGLMPVLCTRTADGVSEAHYIRLLLQHQVAGIVFIGSSYADAGPEYGRELRDRKVPLVLINPADANDGASRVSVDDGAAVDQALAHLRALGHERVGLVLGPVGHVPSARKLAAFVAQQDGSGTDWRDLVAHTTFSMEGGAAVTGTAAQPRASPASSAPATRSRSVSSARSASRVWRCRTTSPWSGFDDSLYMTATDPPLTTLRQPIAAMAAAAVASLQAQINGNVVTGDEHNFEPELIVRGSTRIRAA